MLIDLQHIQKQYGGHAVLTDANLMINERERVGLVGRNGSGKTTLLRMIVGSEEHDAGTIYRRQRLSIGYLVQLPDYPGNSGRDVLQTAFEEVLRLREKMSRLEEEMATTEQLERLLETYGTVQAQFEHAGGYVYESKISAMIDGLKLTSFVDRPFNTLSGGERRV